MANYYVSSVDGDDTSPPSVSWWNGNQTTYATLAKAFTVATSTGDVIYVDGSHNENSGAASITLNAATSGQNLNVIAVVRATGARVSGTTRAKLTINTTAFGHLVGSSGSQHLYMFGVDFSGNSGGSASNSIQLGTATNANLSIVLENCRLNTPSTSGSSLLRIGGGGSSSVMNQRHVLKDCTFTLQNSSSAVGIAIGGAVVEIINPTFEYSGASKPAALFSGVAGTYPLVLIANGDLSGYEKSGGAYVDAASWRGQITFLKCKTSANPAWVNGGTWVNNSAQVDVINCDSGDTHNVFRRYNRLGTLNENASVYAGSGAQFDGAGISWQIVTTSLCNEAEPFITPWFEMWGASTSAETPSIEINWDSATNPNDRNCWAELEYLSSTSFPQGTLSSSRNSQPFDGTAADLSAGAASWTEPGVSNPNHRKIGFSVTPAEKSTVSARVFVGQSIQTLYIDAPRGIS